MKRSPLEFVFVFLSFALSVLSSACHRADLSGSVKQKEITIYTYGSFVSEWGPAKIIGEKFEKASGIKTKFVDCGDGVQLLSRAIIEKNNVQADIILGIDNNTAKNAIKSDILSPYNPQNFDNLVIKSLSYQLGNTNLLTPFDYCHFSIIFNTKSRLPEPKKFSDLTSPAYKNQIILMDPRTSTTGLGFVAWSRAIFPNDEDFIKFWVDLKPNILTMAPGWPSGYGLFEAEEAPLIIGYTTSPAMNLEYDNINYYKALLFEEGHYIQVEGAGILKNAPHRKEAESFMDFLISDEAQSELPLTQWMYPANSLVTLPDCYEKAAVIPAKTLTTDTDKLDILVEVAMSILKN
jgi:thiamine transport system substrate-binding protein